MSRRRTGILLTVLVAAAISAASRTGVRQTLSHYLADPLPLACDRVNLRVDQASSVAYHPGRESILVLSDQGEIVEMDDRFRVMRRFAVPGDPEGVAVNPATGTVFVALESFDAVVEYDLDRQRTLRTMAIDLETHPDTAKGLKRNKGLEGIAVVNDAPNHYFLLAAVEAQPARLLKLTADVSADATNALRRADDLDPMWGRQQTVAIAASFDPGLARISDVTFDPRSRLVLVVSAGERTLTPVTLRGDVLHSFRLPGPKPEGLCLLPGGDALLVDDTGPAWTIHGMSRLLSETTPQERSSNAND